MNFVADGTAIVTVILLSIDALAGLACSVLAFRAIYHLHGMDGSRETLIFYKIANMLTWFAMTYYIVFDFWWLAQPTELLFRGNPFLMGLQSIQVVVKVAVVSCYIGFELNRRNKTRIGRRLMSKAIN